MPFAFLLYPPEDHKLLAAGGAVIGPVHETRDAALRAGNPAWKDAKRHNLPVAPFLVEVGADGTVKKSEQLEAGRMSNPGGRQAANIEKSMGTEPALNVADELAFLFLTGDVRDFQRCVRDWSPADTLTEEQIAALDQPTCCKIIDGLAFDLGKMSQFAPAEMTRAKFARHCLLDRQKGAPAIKAEPPAERQENKRGAKPKPEPGDDFAALRAAFGKRVWKDAGKLDKVNAVAGVLEAGSLARKEAMAAVRMVFPPKPKVEPTDEDKIAAAERRADRSLRLLVKYYAAMGESDKARIRERIVKDILGEKGGGLPTDEEVDELYGSVDQALAKLEELRAAVNRIVVDKGFSEAEKYLDAARAKATGWGDMAAVDIQTAHLRWLQEECPRVTPIVIEGTPRKRGDKPAKATTKEGTTYWLGAATRVYHPSAKGTGYDSLVAHYALIPSDRIIASHNATTFAENKAYPSELQERDYTRDQGEQRKIERQAQHFQPAFVLNSNPDAINGPPVVDADGFVLGGNSRVMTIQRVLEADAEKYDKALAKAVESHGDVFGLDGVDDVKGHILVRVVTGDYDRKTISRALNRAFTQTAGQAASATAHGKMIPVKVYELLSGAFDDEEVNTLTKAIEKHEEAIILGLRESGFITDQTESEYVQSKAGKTLPKLTTHGKSQITTAILAALIGDKGAMATTPQLVLNLYGWVAPTLLGLETWARDNASAFNFTPAFRLATHVIAMIDVSNLRAFEDQFKTQDIFTADDTTGAGVVVTDPLVAILAKWIAAVAKTPKPALHAVLDYWRRIPDRAQMGLLVDEEASTPARLRADTLGKVPGAAFAKATEEEVERIGIVRWMAGLTTPDPNAPKPSGKASSAAVKPAMSGRDADIAAATAKASKAKATAHTKALEASLEKAREEAADTEAKRLAAAEREAQKPKQPEKPDVLTELQRRHRAATGQHPDSGAHGPSIPRIPPGSRRFNLDTPPKKSESLSTRKWKAGHISDFVTVFPDGRAIWQHRDHDDQGWESWGETTDGAEVLTLATAAGVPEMADALANAMDMQAHIATQREREAAEEAAMKSAEDVRLEEIAKRDARIAREQAPEATIVPFPTRPSAVVAPDIASAFGLSDMPGVTAPPPTINIEDNTFLSLFKTALDANARLSGPPPVPEAPPPAPPAPPAPAPSSDAAAKVAAALDASMTKFKKELGL